MVRTYVFTRSSIKEPLRERGLSPPHSGIPPDYHRIGVTNQPRAIANCDLFHVPHLLVTAVMSTNHAASSLCERARGIRKVPLLASPRHPNWQLDTQPSRPVIWCPLPAPRWLLEHSWPRRSRSPTVFFFFTPFASTTIPLAPPPPVKHCNEDELPCIHAAGWVLAFLAPVDHDASCAQMIGV
ncbi:hypothetical protein EDB87DRAFT_1300928 [Lactarius vividus]|nr:hypothetical protein EDB87DRAFT_1300928 [Lactarius vividus]